MKEITLPSGKTATFKQGKGYHLLYAQRKSKAIDEIQYALVAELVEIDGASLTYEELLEMDIFDVSTLITEMNKLGESSTAEQSSSSAQPQDGNSAT